MNRPIMSWRIPFLSSSLLVFSSAALAAGFQWHSESVSWTEPAGTPAATTAESLVTPEYFGLQAIKLWDFDGRTCSMQADQSSLNAPSARPLDAVRFCEPKQTQAWKRADLGTGHFVTAISVCTAQGKDASPAVHGIELWGAAIDANGKLKPAKSSAKLELTSCQRWSPKRSCPAGSVATGIRAHLGDAESGAHGFALRCHAVKVAG
jgi:hypothetical protein